MGFIHNVRTVSHYESKTLRRSWFFRIFTALIIFATLIMTLGTFSPLGQERWNMVALSTTLPQMVIYMVNLLQSLLLIFLATDFMKRDKKVDTNEVLYTRSMSNLEYVLGKTWGIFKLFLFINLMVIAIALVVNIISKEMSVMPMAYVSHLLLISIPTIVFSLGIAYLAMSIIKNHAITIFLLLAYVGVTIFYLYHRGGYIFDFMAFGLPMFKSGIIGYDNLYYVLAQRALYFSIGAASILATTILFRRLPQSLGQVTISRILMIIFLVAAGGSGFYAINEHLEDGRVKKRTLETNERFEDNLFATVTETEITVDHKNSRIVATADLTLRNDHDVPLSHIVLSLNPQLKVTSVEAEGRELPFSRDNHILNIDTPYPLDPDRSMVISVDYSGKINEAYIYPNHREDDKLFPYRVGQFININKRQAFLSDEYLLLTPETHWYPVASLNYYPSNPARIKVDFTNYTLNVTTKKGLTPVAQGVLTEEGNSYKFESETPLTGLTLTISNYLRETIQAEETSISIYYHPGNNYFSEVFTEIGDTLPQLITNLLDDLETSFQVPYPFKSIHLVEAPIQFFSYPRKNTQTRAEVQPEMIIMPERLATINQAGFSRTFRNQKQQAERRSQVLTDKELQLRIFNNFVRTTFITGTVNRGRGMTMPTNEPTRYMLGPSFYFFKNNFYSDKFPVINAVFETNLQNAGTSIRGIQSMMGGLSERDQATLLLKDNSFRDILATTEGEDTLRSVLRTKGDYLFNLMRAQAGIEEFNEWFAAYLDRNKFRRVDVTQFDKDLTEKFGFSISDHLPAWYNEKEIPGFIFTDISVTEVIIDERPHYQVTFTAINPEEGAGLFNVSLGGGILGAMAGGGGRGGGQGGMATVTMSISGPGGMGGAAQRVATQLAGRGMTASDIDKIVWMEPVQAKKIGIITENRPRSISINTLISQNIPGEIMYPVGEFSRAPVGARPFEGEEILTSIPILTEANEVIVDNEDAGFYASITEETSPLRKLLRISNEGDGTYSQVRPFLIPEFWQPVVHADYYGKYVRSAVYTRSGGGERHIAWEGEVTSPGNYDVYTYIPKSNIRVMVNAMRGGGRGGGAQAGGDGGSTRATAGGTTGGSGIAPPEMQQQQAAQPLPDRRGRNTPMVTTLQFLIYHDDGREDVTIDYETAEPGWNRLGTYYLSPGQVKVEMTNNSTGRYVIGDAIKWVKRE